MEEENEIKISRRLFNYLSEGRAQAEKERDEARNQLAELQKKQEEQQKEAQPPEKAEPRYSYGQQEFKPYSISFDTGPETAKDLF